MFIRAKNTFVEVEHETLQWIRSTSSGEIYWECLNINSYYSFTNGSTWDSSKDDEIYTHCEIPELETLYQKLIMTPELQPQIKLELTDKQLEVFGTAIGKGVVRSFSEKQEYWYGSGGWLTKLTEKFGETIVSGVAGQLQYSSRDYERIINLVCDSFIKHVTYHEKALGELGYKIWGAKK